VTIPVHLLSLLDRLSRAPAAMLTRLADDADELWEPFLRDGPAAAIAGER
jgi:hypothetical protein